MKEKIQTLFEDDHIIAVSKPSGLLTIKDRLGKEPNLFDYLKKNYEELRLIHRLDRDTSGLIIFAKNETAQKAFSPLFERHEIVKIYHAIVAGKPMKEEGLIENFIEENLQIPGTYRVGNQKGKLAISFFKVLEQYKRNCLIGFDIRTGRTHQIRVHAKFIGTPLAFDPLYNPQNGIFVSHLKPKFKQNLEEERSIIQRLSLHSQSLAFVHPITQEEHNIECPYPKDFEKALEILRKYSE